MNTASSLVFQDAHAQLLALSEGRVSSMALLEQAIARIQRLDPVLNAVVATDLAAARERARAADEARRSGQTLGRLHGLPITIKDTFEVSGMPCTSGVPALREHRPAHHAASVQKLVDAGAIVFAKTNVPYKALDIQSYNPVYGVTNNPWDTARSPGGSSGGAAVALACGFTALELGSDVGGSIRLPAHFCGVYGHKPSYGMVSLRGHIPGPPGSLSEPDLVVAGPLARSAGDLGLMLDLLAGPLPGDDPGWQLRLPAAGKRRLRDFRVLLWIDDPHFPIDPRLHERYQALAANLREAGVRVTSGSPAGMGLKDIFPLYARQMGVLMNGWLDRRERLERGMLLPFGELTAPAMRHAARWADLPGFIDHFVDGMAMSHTSWQDLMETTLQLRERFLATFAEHDVILAPPTLTTAFAHNHGMFTLRKLTIAGRSRHYTDLFGWISPATLFGLPATSAPVGQTRDGLPMNVQIIGGPHQDRLTLRFVELLAGVAGGFTPPPMARD